MEKRTCDVQTLLNVTKANVCAIMDVARSRFARTSGISTHDSESCGRKASDSGRSRSVGSYGSADARYSAMLYGEKLCLWSMRVAW